MTQLTLFTPTLEQRWATFHQANPEVYRTLRNLALAEARAGRRCGMRMLYEVARWKHRLGCRDGEWKLNNDLAPVYARELMRREPELGGMFEVRER